MLSNVSDAYKFIRYGIKVKCGAKVKADSLYNRAMPVLECSEAYVKTHSGWDWRINTYDFNCLDDDYNMIPTFESNCADPHFNISCRFPIKFQSYAAIFKNYSAMSKSLLRETKLKRKRRPNKNADANKRRRLRILINEQY